MSRIPRHIREEISRSILKRAVEIGWEDLPNSKRSSYYEEWASNPKIGGRLSDYVPPERIRVWIKDGPMKEFKRAKRGLGPYADLAPKAQKHEEEISEKALGQGWQVVDGSIRVKPNRFDAERDDERVTVLWGTRIDLKHLVWAWLNHRHPEDCRLVLVKTQAEPLASTTRAKHDVLAKRLGTEIRYVSL